jgi:hypothetical protein
MLNVHTPLKSPLPTGLSMMVLSGMDIDGMDSDTVTFA